MPRLLITRRVLRLDRLALACLGLLATSPATAEPAVDFNAEVRPIFLKHCLACHGGVKQAGGLSFVTRGLALAVADSGDPTIVPGDHAASYLMDRVADPDDASRMPPPEHGRSLREQEIDTLRRWIDQGADWNKPWAFEAPRPTEPPAVERTDWPRAAMDAFVLRRIEAEGLEPSHEADRGQWLRRATFDLTGLPPTESEHTAFQSDLRPGAYERAVDRLLASPHFGERWTSVWLDLARYADTMGFEKDPERTIWPWRDWVVNAFNADLPYDEFLLKQTAGDLLPDATLEDRLATAFHRNTQTNTEGGTDDEEYRWAAVVDRVDSTWAGVLGVTMGCARCHDHPYDPITQADYYAFASYFNTTQDIDLAEDWPKLRVPEDRGRWAEAERLERTLHEVRTEIHETGLKTVASREAWTPLQIDRAESTGQTRLVLRTVERGVEVVAEGTVTDRSVYTLGAPPATTTITALRIDAGPKDPDTALTLPEMGFVLSRLRMFVERGGETPDAEEIDVIAGAAGVTEAGVEEKTPESDEVFFAEVLADETEGFFRPTDSIRDNVGGWGAYTRIRRPRWAAFLLDTPVKLGPEDRLRIELKHDQATDGQGPLVMQRLTVSTSDATEFTSLANDPGLLALREREAEAMRDRMAIPAAETPVLAEQLAAFRRPTHLLTRGNWMSPVERVSPATPDELPRADGPDDRLGLGRWLGSDANPLTARVMVNRVWAELFGTGLVETVDDFGSTGAEPSHPRLLDHLAVRFQGDLGWSLKRLLKEVVLSASYRQDARADSESIARDPTNRLLARGPRGRLSAEMVRDQALLLSGRFNAKIGGEPVMPYQPAGVWQSVYNNKQWETAAGEDRFRRAIYIYWKRTASYPAMAAFDAPSREQCTVRRATTNTPLQALVTLNDPAFVELAEGLADRMLARTGETPGERIAWATRLAIGHDLPAESLQQLEALYEETLADADERFAMKIVANVILNLDATLTK